jgi:dihydroneopterin aldolase
VLLVKPVARLYIGTPVRRANTMDIVFISELRVETIIGIYDWERKVRQTISLDLEMGADIPRAAATDAIEDTLNYKAVSKRLIEFVGNSEYQLVETLAEKIAEIVISEFNVPWLRLTVHKPGAVRGSRDVGVIIERGSRE